MRHTATVVGIHASMVVAACLSPLLTGSASAAGLDNTERQQIAELIYQRECGGDPAKLTSWNRGEEFASLGIGHFIWYPADGERRFSESFPDLLRFILQRGIVTMPSWLMTVPANPWPDRAAFLAAQASPRMIELRQWLDATRNEQIAFIQARLDAALPRMIEGLSTPEADHIRKQYVRVSQAPLGYFALMDYVNFKGEGINPRERYQGQGWGLLQVLAGMSNNDGSAIAAFVTSAKAQLQQRVNLAPPERHEERWLAGWFARLDGYLNPHP